MRLTLIIYFVVLHALLALVLWKSDFVAKVAEKLSGMARGSEFPDHYGLMVSHHRMGDGHVPDGAVVFIGDSMVQGLCVAAVAPRAVNYGISNDTTRGVLGRLPHYSSLDRAQAIVIAIGVNDLRYRANEDIVDNCGKILDRLPGSVPVVMSAVLPVAHEGGDSCEDLNEARIRPLNERLAELAGKREGVVFADAGGLLSGPRGNLRRDCHLGDGRHLNNEGYRIWIEVLKGALQEALGNRGREAPADGGGGR